MTADAAEQARVAALRSYDVLDRDEDVELAAIARLAASLAGVDKATVNLIDADRQYQAATAGFPRGIGPRSASMCGVTIGLDAPVVLADARLDPRYADSPWVTGELGDIRFYGGWQLRTPDGHAIGTLCVYSESVHTLDGDQRLALADLAGQVVTWLEQRRRTIELESTIDALAASNADLEAFAGRVAHDLRSPLTAVIGFLALAEKRFADRIDPAAMGVISSASAAARRMDDAVTALLAYATLGTSVRHDVVELTELVAVATRDVGLLDTAVAGDVDASLSVGVLPQVRSDPTLLRLLLQNLLSNSMKFRRPGEPATVEVTAGLAPGDDDDGGGWWLAVADHGIGVPVEHRGRVFDLFARADNVAELPGTGIGLSTCARIAASLGGVLELDETPGGGATFTLRVLAHRTG